MYIVNVYSILSILIWAIKIAITDWNLRYDTVVCIIQQIIAEGSSRTLSVTIWAMIGGY